LIGIKARLPRLPEARKMATRALILTLAFAAGLGGAAPAADRFDIAGVTYLHAGGGVFLPETGDRAPIELRAIRHAYDPERDPDVPIFTDVTLPGETSDLRDAEGRPFALITLYSVEPPLEDLPSREAGVDRGLDLRDPSNMIKAAYSNYVSPVLTDDAERRTVPGHPIGHFYVKVEIPGYPPILTGMTTIERADTELVDLTLGRRLGIGGVLLTPEPGRLNASAEAMEELNLRQRSLRVTDGVNYRRRDGVNVGPAFPIEDGNVSFARFRVPPENARDALGVFLEFVARGDHNTFGSLLGRPTRGTGAGCSAFATTWLKGAGVIPFVDEASATAHIFGPDFVPAPDAPIWEAFYNRIRLPWDHIGCDARAGLGAPPQEAAYTVHDLLFHGLSPEAIRAASAGFAEHVRAEVGSVAGTIFRYGALTPLRDLAISSRRKDPSDRGDYGWAAAGEGLAIGFWDNGRFSDWVKRQWSAGTPPEDLAARGLRLVREGRFLGVEVDAMATPRLDADFFAAARVRDARLAGIAAGGGAPLTCRALFEDPDLP
jgi:hypothetical protein